MNIDDIKIGSPEHALALADCLEGVEEASLGPSDIELCVKALRERANAHRTRPIRKISADEPITVEILECCLDRLADIMAKAPQGGEVYLPIWERLEREIEVRKTTESRMARARRRYEATRLIGSPRLLSGPFPI